MRPKQRALVVTVLLTAGCARINFGGKLNPLAQWTAGPATASSREDQTRFELSALARETKTLGTNLTDAYGLHVLEPANGFWAITLDWGRYEDADRVMIGLILDRIVEIAARRTEITGSGRAWEDRAPAERARNLRWSLRNFQERLARAERYRF